MASVTAQSAAAAETGSGARNYGRIMEQTWIWSIVGYSVLRFFIAWGAFSEHGANIWLFGLIDVGTAWPYAKSVAGVCKRAARSEWRQLPAPLVVAVTTFFAPYAYLWFAAGEMPGGVRVAMTICVSVLLVAATTGVLVKTRTMRSEARLATIDDNRSSTLIDLVGADDVSASQPVIVIDLLAESTDEDRSATAR